MDNIEIFYGPYLSAGLESRETNLDRRVTWEVRERERYDAEATLATSTSPTRHSTCTRSPNLTFVRYDTIPTHAHPLRNLIPNLENGIPPALVFPF